MLQAIKDSTEASKETLKYEATPTNFVEKAAPRLPGAWQNYWTDHLTACFKGNNYGLIFINSCGMFGAQIESNRVM